MAVTITRSIWIDDDGTGTTGTVINQALHTTLYNEIDTALAKVAQLAGGNAFTGQQSITGGSLAISAGGITVSGTTAVTVNIRNTAPGTSNAAELSLGNDVQGRALILQSYASNYGSSGIFQANGSLLMTQGAGGLSIGPFDSAPLRFATNGAERMRITPTGQVLVNTSSTVAPDLGQLAIHGDLASAQHLSCLNTGAPAGNFLYFLNNANVAAGAINHASATTVAYVTTSDARLKDDVGRATDVAALRAVVVHEFTWKADGLRDRGVFAQEAHALYPRAVSPGTDDRTSRGDLARPWMTDYSKFVPDLIVGWQQHDTEIAELRAMFAAVKG